MKFVNTYRHTLSNLVVITFLSIVAIVGFPSDALAAPKEKRIWSFQYTLAANAPSNCPTEEYLRTSLATNLDGQDPFEEDAPRSISVTVELISNEVEARIKTQDDNGVVSNKTPLHAPSWRCDQLAERIVFAVQNIVDPLALPSAKSTVTENAPQPLSNIGLETANNAPKKEPTAHSTEKTPMKPRRSPIIPMLGLSLAIGPAWWNAPETALSTTIGIEALWKRTAVGIEGHYEYAWAIPNLPDYAAERTTITVIACTLRRWSARFLVRGCGFGDFGSLSFELEKNDFPRQHVLVADVGARIGASVWPEQSFGVELRADAAYAITRSQVRMQDDRIWQMRPFTGALRVAFLGVFDVF